jgi:hypothetical protein
MPKAEFVRCQILWKYLRENSTEVKSNGNIKGQIRPIITLIMKRQGKLISCLGFICGNRLHPIRFPMNPRGPISVTEGLVQAR